MSIRTLMLALQLRNDNTHFFQFAAALAGRMDADVTGITGCQPACTATDVASLMACSIHAWTYVWRRTDHSGCSIQCEARYQTEHTP